jgi:iron complex transport system substrate-binding protein
MILSDDIEKLASIVVDCGLKVHIDLGPGLMESVYETILGHRLGKIGLIVERQKAIGIHMDGLMLPDAFRVDLLIENKLLLELKSVEKLATIHTMQTLTYLRLMNLPLGLLLNFGEETFKQGIKRIINNYAK